MNDYSKIEYFLQKTHLHYKINVTQGFLSFMYVFKITATELTKYLFKQCIKKDLLTRECVEILYEIDINFYLHLPNKNII